ncbi:hypothetical protein LTR37_007018 [Vermiconidia calcicola]|uniref:Uncharacterized protein n=1 Tax=Vermiconidia calcicola TaxID=1690605 RepID=A0ACC3NFU6_9PEZI|nr:hypothetical protein LTR37_007018 [Vermiconidia calcicola]
MSRREGGQCSRLDEASHETSTGLVTIPREIRDEIYKYLMVHTKEIVLDEMSRIRRLNYEQYPKAVEDYCALALTCKQLSSEAADTFFGSNKILFPAWRPGHDVGISFQHVQRMNSFRIDTSSGTVDVQKEGRRVDVRLQVFDCTFRLAGQEMQQITGPIASPGNMKFLLARSARDAMDMLQKGMSSGEGLMPETLSAVMERFCQV